MPIDVRKLIHLNEHDPRGMSQKFSLSSLDNLLENFISCEIVVDEQQETERAVLNYKEKYNVVCLWDLCRSSWDVEIEIVEKQLHNSLQYTIIYSWYLANT